MCVCVFFSSVPRLSFDNTRGAKDRRCSTRGRRSVNNKTILLESLSAGEMHLFSQVVYESVNTHVLGTTTYFNRFSMRAD